MMVVKETLIEKIISPLPITCLCFLGFMTFIYVYVEKLAEPDLNTLTVGLIVLSALLMLRPRIRKIGNKGKPFKSTKMGELPTPDEVHERHQRQKDGDSQYFGSIIFILSVMYLLFLEVV